MRLRVLAPMIDPIDIDQAWREARLLRRDARTAARLLRAADDEPGPVVRIHGAPIVSDLGDRRLTLLAYENVVARIGARLERLRGFLPRPVTRLPVRGSD